MFLSWSRFFLVTEAIKDQSCVNETFYELLFSQFTLFNSIELTM